MGNPHVWIHWSLSKKKCLETAKTTHRFASTVLTKNNGEWFEELDGLLFIGIEASNTLDGHPFYASHNLCFGYSIWIHVCWFYGTKHSWLKRFDSVFSRNSQKSSQTTIPDFFGSKSEITDQSKYCEHHPTWHLPCSIDIILVPSPQVIPTLVSLLWHLDGDFWNTAPPHTVLHTPKSCECCFVKTPQKTNKTMSQSTAAVVDQQQQQTTLGSMRGFMGGVASGVSKLVVVHPCKNMSFFNKTWNLVCMVPMLTLKTSFT